MAGAARSVARLRPDLLTVHAVGGMAAVRAAVEAAPDTRIVAVTVLTSLGDDDLERIGLAGPVADAVRRLAVLAVEAGARGLVCSPREVAAVRAEVGPDITLITPGVRPAGSDANDQARVATPEEALRAGADLLVIGRPITGAADPGAAAAAIGASLRKIAVTSRCTPARARWPCAWPVARAVVRPRGPAWCRPGCARAGARRRPGRVVAFGAGAVASATR